MPGLAKRRLYKPERAPARIKGVLGHFQAPVACPDATVPEIAMALASICDAGKIEVGRGGEYDALGDTYTIIGKHNGKAQDLKIGGWQVAYIIGLVRQLNGGAPFDPSRLTKALTPGA